MKNALKISSSQSGLNCSWNGGCAYEVVAPGLAKTLEGANNSIEMCGNACVLDTKLSTAAKAVCRIPALATTLSTRQFGIVEAGVLKGKWFATDAKELPKIFDDSVMDDYVDASAACHIGVNLKSG